MQFRVSEENNAPHLLICADEVTDAVSCADLLTDLKLDSLLPWDSERFLRMKPSGKGLLLRQELFSRLLKDTESERVVTSMLDTLTRAKEARDVLSSAECDTARAYIFAELAARTVEFYREAATERDYGRLYSDFSGYFAKECESEGFTVLCSRLGEAAEAARDIVTLRADIDGEIIKLSRECDATMQDKVIACAEKYGIELTFKHCRSMAAQRSIADAAAKLYPAQFATLTAFYNDFGGCFSDGVYGLISELRVAAGIVALTRRADAEWIPYCFPELITERRVELNEVYDVALLMKEGTKIVPNDARFDKKEPFFYLTGANGGGKTTYLRAVGSAVTMFIFGAPVFCRSGRSCLVSSVWTHFPKDERFDGSGRFADEERRVSEILENCRVKADSYGEKDTAPSLVLLNETYSTTNEEKAITHTGKLAHALYDGGCFGLYITHQHAIEEKKIPFLGVLVDEDDANRRTYRIERRRLSNRSFAEDILIKYGISESALRRKFSAFRAKAQIEFMKGNADNGIQPAVFKR